MAELSEQKARLLRGREGGGARFLRELRDPGVLRSLWGWGWGGVHLFRPVVKAQRFEKNLLVYKCTDSWLTLVVQLGLFTHILFQLLLDMCLDLANKTSEELTRHCGPKCAESVRRPHRPSPGLGKVGSLNLDP